MSVNSCALAVKIGFDIWDPLTISFEKDQADHGVFWATRFGAVLMCGYVIERMMAVLIPRLLRNSHQNRVSSNSSKPRPGKAYKRPGDLIAVFSSSLIYSNVLQEEGEKGVEW